MHFYRIQSNDSMVKMQLFSYKVFLIIIVMDRFFENLLLLNPNIVKERWEVRLVNTLCSLGPIKPKIRSWKFGWIFMSSLLFSNCSTIL